MSRYTARIIDDAYTFTTNAVRLAIRDDDRNAYLLADGTWVAAPEGAAVPEMGVILPRASVEAIAIAVAEWQGHTSHADTEARVLREWLAVEQARVERVLAR